MNSSLISLIEIHPIIYLIYIVHIDLRNENSPRKFDMESYRFRNSIFSSKLQSYGQVISNH